ncbi:MAG: cytochrome P460 family protein [Alphaproteobacteria bacterium]
MSIRAIGTKIAALICLAGAAMAADSTLVAFPDGYRAWYHNHSTAKPESTPPDPESGISNIYLNALALDGFKTGTFKTGAILVLDRFHIVEDTLKIQRQGARKVILVMERDEVRFKETGGWGWEAFLNGERDRRLVTDNGKACFACHKLNAANTFLFTKLRD